MKIIIVTVAAIGVTASLLAGCGTEATARDGGTASGEGTTAYPAIMENCGTEVTVPKAPERIVSIDQEATEILIHLGVSDRIVAMGAESYPVSEEIAEEFEKIPVLGPDSLTIPYEKLLEANPDFVVSTYVANFSAQKSGEREELHKLGIATYLSEFDCVFLGGMEGLTFEKIFDEYARIGELLDVPAAADALIAKQRAALDEGLAIAKGVEDAPSLLWFYAPYAGTPYVAGSGGVPQHISDIIGAKNVFDDTSNKWFEVSWDQIGARNPDIIVLADLTRGLPGDTAAEKIELLKADPVTSKLDAVINDRFIVVPANYMDASYGSALAVETVAKGLAEFQ